MVYSLGKHTLQQTSHTWHDCYPQAPPLATDNETLTAIIAQEDIVNIERVIAVFSPTDAIVFYNRCVTLGAGANAKFLKSLRVNWVAGLCVLPWHCLHTPSATSF